jgi:Flp pilus assembly protein TadB
MTTELLALAAGAISGLGVFVFVSAWRGRLNMSGITRNSVQGSPRHVVVAGVVLVVTWLMTGWTLAAVTIGVVSAMASTALSRYGKRRDDRTLVDAIAVWTEQLRDMLAGSNGLEQTITTTATHAPAALREPLERLVVSMSYSPLPQALARFARDVNHPTADFVVAALSTAATRQVRELGALLGHLAACARDEARMHTRIWVGRSRTRSAVKIIASVVIVFVGGLVVLSPEYLAPYRTAEGQLVLSVIVLVFFGALLLMQRLSVIVAPDRFVGRRLEARP